MFTYLMVSKLFYLLMDGETLIRAFQTFMIVLLTKSMDYLTLKRHNSFQNKSYGKATYSFTPIPLIFKLQQEVLKFDDICVSWSSPKTDPVRNFLSLQNRRFENISFFH